MECGGLLPRNREGKPSHSKKNMAEMMIKAFPQNKQGRLKIQTAPNLYLNHF